MRSVRSAELLSAMNSAALTMENAIQSATGCRATIHKTRAKEILKALHLAVAFLQTQQDVAA